MTLLTPPNGSHCVAYSLASFVSFLTISLTTLSTSPTNQDLVSYNFSYLFHKTVAILLECSYMLCPPYSFFFSPPLFYQLLPGWFTHSYCFNIHELPRIPDSYLQHRPLWWAAGTWHILTGVSNAPDSQTSKLPFHAAPSLGSLDR